MVNRIAVGGHYHTLIVKLPEKDGDHTIYVIVERVEKKGNQLHCYEPAVYVAARNTLVFDEERTARFLDGGSIGPFWLVAVEPRPDGKT